MPDNARADYLWGNSKSEIGRIVTQSEVLRPATCRLLEAAGTKLGMRVLDVGCGAGDVALLARDMVGPQGSVVGIDQDLNILAVARDRARAEGKPDITRSWRLPWRPSAIRKASTSSCAALFSTISTIHCHS